MNQKQHLLVHHPILLRFRPIQQVVIDVLHDYTITVRHLDVRLLLRIEQLLRRLLLRPLFQFLPIRQGPHLLDVDSPRQRFRLSCWLVHSTPVLTLNYQVR